MPLKNIKQIEQRHLLGTYNRYDILVDRGSGPYLIDRNNRRYLDLIAGLGVNALGYAHPRMLRLLRKQIKKPLHVSNLLYHEFAGPLAARLAGLSGLDRVFFTNSGTESVEGALKFARLHANASNAGPGRRRVLAVEGAFHGRTMGALSATHSPKYREPFEPLLEGFDFVRLNDTADLERRFDDDVAAVIIETIQGEGGIRPVSREFYSAARRLTRKHGAALIIDEVQCGLARTGRWFAVHRFAPPGMTDSMLPDMIALAKPLGAGIPMGAVLLSENVAGSVQPGMHGHTFAGGPLACRLSMELIRVIEEEKLLEHARDIGGYFIARLRELEHPLVREVRGDGLMIAVELGVPSRPIVQDLIAEGYITNSTSETVLRLLPPLIIRRKHVDKFVAALRAVLDAVHRTR
jgi:acetylornithine aminotransferase/acetylornithine/N-succinyldiaminopimelate aminotransferase